MGKSSWLWGQREREQSNDPLVKRLQSDLNLAREHISQLERLVNVDPDTDLPKRHVLARFLARATLDENRPFALGILRLDENYHKIRFARDRSKIFLFVTAERMKAVLGDGRVYQGDRPDEFYFVVEDYGDVEQLESLVREITEKVSESQNPPASDIIFGCHIGAALFPDHAVEPERLELNAEIALGVFEYRRWSGFLFTPEMGDEHRSDQNLEHLLRAKIHEGFAGFHLAYQPVVLPDGSLHSAEALLRWTIPERGEVSPEIFIGLAERSGLILHLGKWALYSALRQLKAWREDSPDLAISVNVSAVQVAADDFVQSVFDALDNVGLPGEALHLELTERSLMEHPDRAAGKLTELKERGVGVMIDDFGTGYSSLAALKKFPIDTLKVAKEFVDNLPGDEQYREMVRTIIHIAHTFSFQVLAEGVENDAQRLLLLEEGSDYLQGFFFSPPVGAPEFRTLYLAEDPLL